MVLVKNINSVHRIEGVNSQFGLQGALAANKVDLPMNRAAGLAANVVEKINGVVGS